MKHRFMKVLACLSLVLMVFSAVTPGAFADETGTTYTKEFGDQKMMHTPHGNPEMNGKEVMDALVFDTEEEEMEFLVERETESINNRIERLNEMLENIDEIADDNINEDSIQEQITELETLLSDIESATTLDELKETLEEYRESNPQPRGHGGERGPINPDFEEEVTA